MTDDLNMFCYLHYWRRDKSMRDGFACLYAHAYCTLLLLLLYTVVVVVMFCALYW